MTIHIDRTASGQYITMCPGTSPSCVGRGDTIKAAVGDLIVSFPTSCGVTLCFDFNLEPEDDEDDEDEINAMLALAVREFQRP